MRKTRQMLALEQQHGDSIERLMTAALTEHDNNVTQAASSLGINVKTFWTWMMRLRIQIKKTVAVT